MVERELDGDLILPALFTTGGPMSYGKVAHSLFEGEYPICPVAILWSNCRQTVINRNTLVELMKEVVLMRWINDDIILNNESFFWVPLSSARNTDQHFFDARTAINEELANIKSTS